MKTLTEKFIDLNLRIMKRKNVSDLNAETTFSMIAQDVLLNSNRAEEYANAIINAENVGYYGECIVAELFDLLFHTNKNAHYDLIDKKGKKYEIKTFVSNGTKETSEEEFAECDYIYIVYYNRKLCQLEIRKCRKVKALIGKRLKVKDIEKYSEVVKVIA